MTRLGIMGIPFAAALFLNLAVVLEPQIVPAAGSDATAGKALYGGKGGCVNCHGAGGRGDGPAGKMLVPPPADLAGPKTKAKSDAELLKTIQEGRPGTAMVPFKGQLTEQEIRDLLAYVRSLSK
nr:cytochrome c [Nitrospirota bacterium]